MSAPIDDPVPEPADTRPRLGELLLSAGLLTGKQLEDSLASARTAGKPLGHVLVEEGIVPAHSIAMALADQHGGPLKSEFGFATGRGATPRPPDLARQPSPSAPPVLRLAPEQPVADVPPATVAVTPTAVSEQLDAETAARLSAEAQADKLLARVEELQADLDAAGPRAAEEAAAPLRSQLEVLRARLDAQAANDEALTKTREELATARAAEAASRTQLAAEREAREQDAKTVEAWRTQLEDARAQNELAATAAADLRAQLDQLLADGKELRLQLAAERATNEGATTSTEGLTAQIEELRSQRAADSAALSAAEAALAAARGELADAAGLREAIASERAKRSTAEETLAGLRDDLATALADLDAVRATLAAERDAHQEAAGAVDALRARLSELDAAAQEAEAASVVVPHDEELVDELRAVIELQEQALAAAAARERARDGDARVVVDRSSTRSYAADVHFLFAPSGDGYELLERAGASPAPGELVELSGGRTCRVLRVGPAPFPGAPEQCAYLELA